MANNIWSNYTEKTATPVDADEVMVRDSTDGKNKRLLFGTFWKWVAKKLNEATISELQTNNKTIIGAINALNSELDFVTFASSSNEVTGIKKYLITNKPKSITIFKVGNSGCAIATPYNTYGEGYIGFLYFDYFASSPSDLKLYSYQNGKWIS
jgi:hypothetical protein